MRLCWTSHLWCGVSGLSVLWSVCWSERMMWWQFWSREIQSWYWDLRASWGIGDDLIRAGVTENIDTNDWQSAVAPLPTFSHAHRGFIVACCRYSWCGYTLSLPWSFFFQSVDIPPHLLSHSVFQLCVWNRKHLCRNFSDKYHEIILLNGTLDDVWRLLTNFQHSSIID